MMKAHTSQTERPTALEPGSLRAVLFFTVFALLLHVPVGLVPESWLFSKEKPKPRAKRVVYVSRVARQGPRRYKRTQRRLQRNKKLARKKKKPKRRQPPPLKGQVVDVAPTPDDRPPKKTRFVSQYNTRVKKETISRHRRLKYKMAMPRLTRRKKAPPRRQRARAKKLAMRLPQMRRPQKRKSRSRKVPPKPRKPRRALAIPKQRRRRKAALPKSKRGTRSNQRKRPEVSGRGRRLSLNLGPPLKIDPSLRPMPNNSDRGSQGSSNPSNVNLRPDYGTLSRIEGAPAPDHVKNVPVGDATYLNTRRHIYASFFNRVKQQVAQHWNPTGTYRRRDPYGNVYGVRDRHTTLQVILTKSGKLTKVSVLRSSGLSFLDREAMRAFREAQPFPNPPKGLVSKDGKIRFKFGFFLQVSSPPRMMFFR